MRDSDWSRANLLRSDWLPISVAIMTTSVKSINNIVANDCLQRSYSGCTFLHVYASCNFVIFVLLFELLQVF